MWQGEKIELAEIRREYVPQYVEWLNDWEVSQFLMPGMPVPITLEGETAWFESRSKDPEHNIIFAILALPNRNLIGNCGLHKLDLKNRSAEFGIFVGDKNYWGKGYGTDATRTLLKYGFEQLGLNRIELEVYDFNPRAIRAYEKAGFRRDGIKRQALYRNDAFHDVYLMGILHEDWSPSVDGAPSR